MSADTSEKQGFLSRTISMKWAITAGLGLIVLLAVIVVIVLVVDRGKEEAVEAPGGGGTDPTAATSPYDLVELPVDVGIDRIEDAAFVSLFLSDETGAITSYGISLDLPATQALTQAIRDADEVSDYDAATALGAKAADSTITFVLPTRETLTFALYLQEGMIARGAAVWQPDGDLKALVEAAIAGP